MLRVFEHEVLREYVDKRETERKRRERENNTSTEKIT
jgi:hypothetical protein